jgi:hypothetical protein
VHRACFFFLAACQTAAVGSPPHAHPRLLLTGPLLETLSQRAAAGSAEWKALRGFCDEHLGAKVWWPDQGADLAPDRIASGYQGEDYFKSIVNLGLCAQVTKKSDPKRAAAYAKLGAEVLEKMSAPDAPHAPNPLHDDGYGIRFYGEGMALGYDWLNEWLSAEEKSRVSRALNHWLEVYDQKGFGRDHPVGNYFAAYYASKVMAALATEGENPNAAAQWKDWFERLHRQMVQPYFAANLAGGGWPEGWNYGPLATINMILPILAVKSAKGFDLVKDPHGAFAFPLEQARHVMYFAWPDRRTMDERGAHHAGDHPSEVSPIMFQTLAGVLEAYGDPLAPQFHRYAHEILDAAGPQKQHLAMQFLFWNPSAPEADYKSLPLSYWARGMNSVAMRSSWANDAVWSEFTSGAYVGSPDSGEMGFDQGTLLVSQGSRPLLLDAITAMHRHTPGTQDGDKSDDDLYRDAFGNNEKNPNDGNRTLYNIFYARASHYGQVAAEPGKTKTRIARFEDHGDYVLITADHLEDMFRQPRHAAKPVVSWTRQVIYLRPSLFVIDDRTRVADSSGTTPIDQWLSFHLKWPVTQSPDRVELDGGSLIPLLPQPKLSLVNVFNRGKVARVEEHASGETLHWLNVLQIGRDKAEVKLLPDGVQITLAGKKWTVNTDGDLRVQ